MAFFHRTSGLFPNTIMCAGYNIAAGSIAMTVMTTGGYNTAIGGYSLGSVTTGNFNTAVGYAALYSITGGGYNTAVGDFALPYINQSFSTAIGYGAGYKGGSGGGDCETYVGAYTAYLTSGSGLIGNTLVGYAAGYGLTTGVDNTLIGYLAGCQITTGRGNTIISICPPTTLQGCTNVLLISWGCGAAAPCGYIRGLAAGGMSLGNTTSVGTSFNVTGEIVATADITAYYSDRRLKDNIIIIDCALNKISGLTGVKYNANQLAKKFHFENEKTQLGLLADEVEKVIPEAVNLAPFDMSEDKTSISGENYLTVKYERIIPILIEGVKELHKKIIGLDQKLRSHENHGISS